MSKLRKVIKDANERGYSVQFSPPHIAEDCIDVSVFNSEFCIRRLCVEPEEIINFIPYGVEQLKNKKRRVSDGKSL